MTTPLAKSPDGQLNQAIANAVVRGHKRVLGRGPMRAQAFFRHNYVAVVLEDRLTQSEQSLVAGGERDAVLDMRLRYQQVLRDELVRAIEELTARKVEAFLSGSHIGPGLAFELFVLDRPPPGEHADPASVSRTAPVSP
jgi:uncharacterized protein YbcI